MSSTSQRRAAPCSAVLRLAPGRSGEAAAARWAARKSRAQGVAAGSGVRPEGRGEKGFWISYTCICT